MANSFFNATDVELYSGSKNFATLISSSASSYGLSVEQAAAYQILNDSYAAAYQAIQTPSTRTKAATARKNSAKILLKSMAADLAKIIDGHPTITEAQKLLLGLNVRKTPSPIDAPGTPTSFTAALRSDGLLRLKWKCKHPPGTRGVIYQVYRSVDGGESAYLGGAGRREFIDTTVPAGAPTITYTIQATRTTTVGVAADFLVKFGAGSGGTMTASVTESKPTKLAA